MKVGVIGPKGQCGSCVVDELLSRGHSVVGISRNPPADWKGSEKRKYSSVAVDLYNTKNFSEVLSDGFDAIVSAYGPPLDDLRLVYDQRVEGQAKIKSALLKSTHKGVFIIIGGAGSLDMKHGGDFVDEPHFAYGEWYLWPDAHLEYMRVRTADHGSYGLSRFIRLFKWARNNVEYPGRFSWLFRPFARLFLSRARKILTSRDVRALVTASRIALRLWEGVRDKQWSFLSPPWLLRDKGIRTGKYQQYVDTPEKPAYQGTQDGIYNEDMAVAIVDEVENNKLAYKHWTCTGPINLKQW